MDFAALEKLHTLRDQCRGSRAMAKVFALGTSQLRQNQKPHERCFQPCHSTSSVFPQSHPVGSAEFEKKEDSCGVECQRSPTVVTRTGPQRTDPRSAGCRHGVENERIVWAEVEGCRLRCQ